MAQARLYRLELISNPAPSASFTFTPTNLSVAFNASLSSDASGIASYDWSWGDSTASGTGVSPTHVYATDGTYTVTLTVTDIYGASTQVSHNVTAISPGAQTKGKLYRLELTTTATSIPTARFSFVATNLSVVFNSSTSTVTGGTIASWAWDFGDSATSTAQNPTHAYTADGNYVVTLVITDNNGFTSAVSHTVGVAAPGGGSKGRLYRLELVSQPATPFTISGFTGKQEIYTSVTLTASANCSWTQTAGTAVSITTTANSVTFTIPAEKFANSITFRATNTADARTATAIVPYYPAPAFFVTNTGMIGATIKS